ncbi:MAG: glycosyltransferase family 2 protein [Magnetospirillum sp.]|nr:glycosyltransferase family 2 protein [Magnetospirillum sp.]
MSSDALARVSAILVTYNSGAVLADSLPPLARLAKVIVVDNASADDTVSAARRALPQAEVVAQTVNVGFGNGCNAGLARVDTEFALLVNPDAIVPPEAVRLLVEAADRYGDAAILGPALLTPAGKVELSHNLGLFDQVAHRKRADSGLAPEGDLCAGFLSGAVMLLRMDAIAAFGGFDPDIFLFYEDTELCLRAAAAGWSLVHVPAARVTHVGGGSSRPSPRIDWLKQWHMAWSRLHVERKYHGRAAPLALPLLLRHGLKALGYGLLLKRAKVRRNAARFAGTVAALAGRPACSPAVRLARCCLETAPAAKVPPFSSEDSS